MRKRQKQKKIKLQNIKIGLQRRSIKPNEKLKLKHMLLKDYVIDGEVLDWYLNHGLKLGDIKIKNKLQYVKSGG